MESSAGGGWSKAAWTMTALWEAAVTTPAGLSAPAATPTEFGLSGPVVSFLVAAEPCGETFPAASVTVAVTVTLPSARDDAFGVNVADVSPALSVTVAGTTFDPSES